MGALTAIDLFAGCGGLSDGFESSGLFRMLAHVEWEKAPCETLQKRLIKKFGYDQQEAARRVLRYDIQKTTNLIHGWAKDLQYGTHEGLSSLLSSHGTPDAVIGGPPCQAYSMAGRVRDEHGMQFDYRNYLFESYLKVVEYFRPRLFLFENVPGMLSASPGGLPIVERIRTAFEDAGYEIIDNLKEHALIDLTDFGIPQKRSRVIILGLCRHAFQGDRQEMLRKFYSEILSSRKVQKLATVGGTIGDLPAFHPTEKHERFKGRNCSHMPFESEIPNHWPRFHNQRDIEIFQALAEDIESGRNQYVATDAIKRLYTERTGKTSNVHKYYVLRWGEPSNTIPAHLYKDGLRHIHPDPKQARSITVREAAELQTFDRDFEFHGSMGDQYKMIGNAVPPRFSKILAEAVSQFLNSMNSDVHEVKLEKVRLTA